MYRFTSTQLSIFVFTVLLSIVNSRATPGNSRNLERVTEPISPSESSAVATEAFERKNPSQDPPVLQRAKKIRSAERQYSPGRGLAMLDESAIAALSKLANLRLLNLAHGHMEQRRALLPKNSPPVGTTEEFRELEMPSMISGRKRLVNGTEAFDEKLSRDTEKLEFKPRKFHCHPIEDIFIPAVDKKVPAYICKLELRQFILSSDRFLRDSRNHLDVTIDETTFHRLLIRGEETGYANSMASVIPVTLTQQKGEEFYGVKKT